MSSSRPDAALDPTVPLEQVEAWIASPETAYVPAQPVAQPVEVVTETTYAQAEPFAPVGTPSTPVAEVPVADTQYLSPFGPPAEVPVVSAAATTNVVDIEAANIAQRVAEPVQQWIAPVRSPGIVVPTPEPAPEPAAVVTEDLDDEVAERPLGRRLAPWLFLVLGVLAALFVLAQLVPGWWSRFIAGLVDGYTARGAGWGAAIGFVFTYAATMLIGHAVHKWSNWKAPVALVVGGLLVASPNLFTLWINHGPTTAARTANALLDRSAPLFRGASLAGAAGGLALGILTTVLYRLWRKRTRRLKAMESLVDDYA